MAATGLKERTATGGRRANVHPNGRRVFRLDSVRPGSYGTSASRRRPAAEKLPTWRELPAVVNGSRAKVKGPALVDTVTTRQFVAVILVIAAAFTLYVGHVQATQDLLSEVQHARRENLRLHLKYNRLKGEFDYATSPAVVYERAKALGLEEGYSYGATIRVE